VSAQKLYAAYFAAFGVAAPQPVKPAPIPPSNVDKPPQPQGSSAPATGASPSPSGAPVPARGEGGGPQILVATVVLVALVGGIALLVRRRVTASAP
jgi:hypothetical protein